MDDTQLLIASIRIEIQVVGQTRRGVSRILVWRRISSEEDPTLYLTPDRQNFGPYPKQSLSYFFEDAELSKCEETNMQNRNKYKISFPRPTDKTLAQNEAFFYLRENGDTKKLRFHDYDELYKRPGLYEQLFYDRLKCSSPPQNIGSPKLLCPAIRR